MRDDRFHVMNGTDVLQGRQTEYCNGPAVSAGGSRCVKVVTGGSRCAQVELQVLSYCYQNRRDEPIPQWGHKSSTVLFH